VDKVKNIRYVMAHIKIIIMELSLLFELIQPNLRNRSLASAAVGMFHPFLSKTSHVIRRYSQNALTGSPLCDGTHRKILSETATN
jgi:hypothetical protein